MQNQTVVEQVMEKLVEGIASGKYKVGDKLPNEFELLEEFGVCRNSLRETIKVLCAMGILEIRRGDGTYVCSQMSPSIFDKIVYGLILNLSTGDELVELREMIDEQTVRGVIDKIDDIGLLKIKGNLEAMIEATENGDMKAVQNLDYSFHMLLIDLCKNSFYSRMAKGVYSIYVKYMIRNLFETLNAQKAIEYHTNIYNCIKNKDVDNVKNVVRESLDGWRESLANKEIVSIDLSKSALDELEDFNL
jgi:GntR family transcriptional repressor for pyruvate dehydrogenase complex